MRFAARTSHGAPLLYSLRWCKVLCKWPDTQPPTEHHPTRPTPHNPPSCCWFSWLVGWSCMRMQQTAFLLLAILAIATPILKEPKWPKRRAQLLRFRFHIWEFGSVLVRPLEIARLNGGGDYQQPRPEQQKLQKRKANSILRLH